MPDPARIYALIGRLTPVRSTFPTTPRRIVLIQPCCIGDVVLATPVLKALRQAYPQAQIVWAVGRWSQAAIEQHPLLDELLDTGQDALPVHTPGGLWHFVRQLRAGHFDLAISLVRSPLMSLALLLSGIPWRAGLDSRGRGFGYNLRVSINPDIPRHEAEIYLDVIRRLDLDTGGCYVNVPVQEKDQKRVQQLLTERGIQRGFIVINPAGGSNPGMVMDAKRYPPGQLARLADELAGHLNTGVVLIGGPNDGTIVEAVQRAMETPTVSLVGILSFGEIAALAAQARVYIGNDTGLTHLAAAAGAKTVMILGPSDPARYAPFAPNALALWKPVPLRGGGVASGTPADWDWSRDGISVEDALTQTMIFLDAEN